MVCSVCVTESLSYCKCYIYYWPYFTSLAAQTPFFAAEQLRPVGVQSFFRGAGGHISTLYSYGPGARLAPPWTP
eukprot:s5_g47.t1